MGVFLIIFKLINQMETINKKINKDKSTIIIKNPSKALTNFIKARLEQKKRQREIDSKNIHIHFPS